MIFDRRYVNHIEQLLEDERERSQQLLELERARADRAEAEVRRLTDVIVDLRKDGFNAVPPELEIEEPDDPLEEELRQAIAERAYEGTPEWSHLEREARRELARGVSIQKVIEDIREGDDPNQYLD